MDTTSQSKWVRDAPVYIIKMFQSISNKKKNTSLLCKHRPRFLKVAIISKYTFKLYIGSINGSVWTNLKSDVKYLWVIDRLTF